MRYITFEFRSSIDQDSFSYSSPSRNLLVASVTFVVIWLLMSESWSCGKRFREPPSLCKAFSQPSLLEGPYLRHPQKMTKTLSAGKTVRIPGNLRISMHFFGDRSLGLLSTPVGIPEALPRAGQGPQVKDRELKQPHSCHL